MSRLSYAIVCLLAVGPAARALAAEPALRLVDDRGEAIADPVSVCFQVDLASQCTEVAPGKTVALPPSFASLRAEGAHHGPVSVRSRDLQPGPDGGPTAVTVPRKAFLQVEKLPADPVTFSAFRPQAPSFRNPLFRAVVPAAGLEVPSGDLVVSLSARGAPDLQRLSAAPGSQVKLTYHARSGSSLIVRCKEAAGNGLVTGAAVGVLGRSEVTGKDGLALLSGLPAGAGAVAVVSHPKYLAQQLGELGADPGTFAFHEVLLEKGSALSVHVTLNGQPAKGARCAVVRADQPGIFGEGEVGADGFCRPGQLAAGAYVLRLSVPPSLSFVDQAFTARDGLDTELEVPLSSIHVSGRISIGRQPAAGYTVEANPVQHNGLDPDASVPPLQASTNEYGDYEGTLWAPGDYIFRLTADSGALVAGERRVDLESPEETVDFALDGAGVGGQVVDEKGRPVEGAQVTLLWEDGDVTTTSGPDGRFEILVAREGLGNVFAEKPGFESSRPQEVSARSASISTVTLVMHSDGSEAGPPSGDGEH